MGNGDGFMHWFFTLIEWNAITCLNVDIVNWFYLNKMTHKPDSLNRMNKFHAQFCIIFFFFFSLLNLDRFQRAQQDNSTEPHTELIGSINGKRMWLTGYQNTRKLKIRSSQLHHEFTNFRTISKSLIAFYCYHNCGVFWILVPTWEFVVVVGDCLIFFFCIKFLLFIEWVSFWLFTWISDQWNECQIRDPNTQKQRLKATLYFAFERMKPRIHILWLSSTSLFHRLKSNRHRSAD